MTWDVIIAGGGPAGLSAGTYLSRAGWSALLVERGPLGGQARRIARIENYPGFPRGISGAGLMRRFAAQARRWGLRVLASEVRGLRRRPDGWAVRAGRKTLRCRAAILCPGAAFRRLGLPGEARWRGRGVYDAAFERAAAFAGTSVAVVGAGDAAVHQALLLSRHAARVHLICRGGKLKAIGLLRRRLESRANVETLFHSVVARLEGRAALEAVVVRGRRGAPTRRLAVAGLFVLIGKEPEAALCPRPAPPGLFVAGDAAPGAFRQVAIASGDGLRAAMECERLLLAWDGA